MLTTNEVCDMLRITARTLYEYAKKGWITKHKINATHNVYALHDVLKLKARLRHDCNHRESTVSIRIEIH